MKRKADLTKSQLFLDDLWIDEQHKLTRLWHPADIYPEPVLRAEKPWEGTSVRVATVMKTGDYWKMYYEAHHTMHARPVCCVAESNDGMQWERPSLGLVEYRGNKQNNILPVESGKALRQICHDPEDEEAPFKMIHLGLGGILGATSRDGYQWTELDKPLISSPPAGDVQALWFNKVDGRYIITHKTTAGRSRRAVCIAESEDFRSFSDSRLIIKADLIDPPDIEYHGMMGFAYADLHLGLIERWINVPNHFELLLTWSHDRKTWHRPISREPFIGAACAWNQGSSKGASSPPYQVGNQLWFHFTGGRQHRNGIHFCAKAGPPNRQVVGLATITVDRFASITAGFMEGQLITKPMTWPGGDLLLNASTTRHFDSYPLDGGGATQVEVWDESGQPVEGFSGESAAPFDRNVPTRGTVEPAAVRWPGDRSLDALAGQRIRLMFLMRDSHLFSFHSSGTQVV